jgi:hypothetical protein
VGLKEIGIDLQSFFEMLSGGAQIAGLECFLGALELFEGFGGNAELAGRNQVVGVRRRRGFGCRWGGRFETQTKVLPRVINDTGNSAVCGSLVAVWAAMRSELSMDV